MWNHDAIILFILHFPEFSDSVLCSKDISKYIYYFSFNLYLALVSAEEVLWAVITNIIQNKIKIKALKMSIINP